MSDHLPECDVLHMTDEDDGAFCICRQLRACEERVREDERMIRQEEKRISYMEGVEAAREAVAALYDEVLGFPPRATVLAAIDALKEKP